jgi:hypothetical protein
MYTANPSDSKVIMHTCKANNMQCRFVEPRQDINFCGAIDRSHLHQDITELKNDKIQQVASITKWLIKHPDRNHPDQSTRLALDGG